MSTYSIKDLEQLTGIKAHTIRIWEQRYNIVSPQRTDTNLRYYNSEDLKMMLNVSTLNNNGHKISKIAKMSNAEINNHVLTVISKKENHSDQIRALTLSMVEMDENRFEKIMANNILQHGFEDTMINIVFPFLIQIGYLWQTNAVNPAQEHFMTNLIRQKIYVAIDGQFSKQVESQHTFMLFLPEGELHEISLLFACYLIRARGFKVYYLGQSLPLSDLNSAYMLHEPDFLLSIITSTPGNGQIQKYVDTLSETFSDANILLTGSQIVGQGLNMNENIEVLFHFNTLIDLLKQVQKAK
ncbi:MAG: DNA-binding transcriptional MerR regulator [Arenicella sp.]|jgi:DNA-binding transcriptional MerR regulator